MTDITYPYKRVLVLLLIAGISYLLMEFAWVPERGRFIPIGQTLGLLYSAWCAKLYREEILRGDDVYSAWGWALFPGPGLLLSWIYPSLFEMMTAAVVIFVGFLWCFVLAIWENIRFVLRRYFDAHIDDWWPD